MVPAANVLRIRDRRFATFLLDFVRALITMRAQRIDTIIDMEFFSRASAVFAFLSGASTRVGLHRFTGELPYRDDLMTHRIQYTPHLHVSLLYVVLLEAAFGDNSDEPLLKVPVAQIDDGVFRGAVFEPSPAETAQVRTLVGGTAGAAHPVILLNPNASDLLPLRKWESAKFVELGRRLLAEFPQSRLVVTGAPAERAAADQLCRAIDSPRAVSAAGRTSLRELLTLYTLASVLVTNDSGPAHFASLTPMHTVVLFGPETPLLFGSRSPATTIVWKQLACSPCVSVFNHRLSPCRNNVCMQSITVDDVFDAVRRAVTP